MQNLKYNQLYLKFFSKIEETNLLIISKKLYKYKNKKYIYYL